MKIDAEARAESEALEALYRQNQALIAWIHTLEQPHPAHCDAWVWAHPFGEDAMERCDCGLAKLLGLGEVCDD